MSRSILIKRLNTIIEHKLHELKRIEIMAKTIKMKKVVKAIKVAYNGVTNEEALAMVPVFIRKAA